MSPKPDKENQRQNKSKNNCNIKRWGAGGKEKVQTMASLYCMDAIIINQRYSNNFSIDNQINSDCLQNLSLSP